MFAFLWQCMHQPAAKQQTRVLGSDVCPGARPKAGQLRADLRSGGLVAQGQCQDRGRHRPLSPMVAPMAHKMALATMGVPFVVEN